MSDSAISSGVATPTVAKPGAKRQRKSVRQDFHEFIMGNPCGPCEWHIEKDVRIFAWFDLIFQSMFIIPVILEFKLYWPLYLARDTPKTTTPGTTTTGKPQDCDEDKLDMAVMYFIADMLNLSLGMFSDILIYVATCQKNNKCGIAICVIFLICSILREILHIVGVALHMLRCAASTYPYEIAVRLLCHYMVWGFWIVLEYCHWIRKGRHFVPQRGIKEPPILELKIIEVDETLTTSTFASSVSSWAETDEIDSSEMMAAPKKKKEDTGDGGGDEAEGDKPKKKRRSKRKSKTRKSKSKSKDNGDQDGGGAASPGIVSATASEATPNPPSNPPPVPNPPANPNPPPSTNTNNKSKLPPPAIVVDKGSKENIPGKPPQNQNKKK